MAEGNKPVIRIHAKAKAGDTRIDLFAGWERDGKVSSLTVDKNVGKLVAYSTDGEVLAELLPGRESEFWVNIQDYRQSFDNTKTNAKTVAKKPAATSDDVGF